MLSELYWLSWHITCSAELWRAVSHCAALNWATLGAKHKCRGVKGEPRDAGYLLRVHINKLTLRLCARVCVSVKYSRHLYIFLEAHVQIVHKRISVYVRPAL